MNSTIVRKDASVAFSALTVHGDVVYFEDQNALVVIDRETGLPERLSVNLAAYDLTPRPGHVFIKDWSEGAGVASSLENEGVIEIIGAYLVGPHASTAYEARVVI